MSIKKISIVLVSSILCANLCGCNAKVDNDSVLDVGDSFLDAVLEVNSRKLLKLVIEDDKDSDYFDADCFQQDISMMKDILEDTIYEADEDSVKFGKNNTKGSAEYSITMPDIDDEDEQEFTVTIDFIYEDDEWLVANFEEVCDDIYGDMLAQQPLETTVPTEVDESELSENPTVETTVETTSETTVETSEALADKEELTMDDVYNANWDDGILYFDGNIYLFPFDYSSIARRWIMLDEHNDGFVLNPGDIEHAWLEVLGSQYTHMTVDIANIYSEGIIDIKNGQCLSISYSYTSDGVDLSDFVLPGGVTYGMTLDEITEIYGEPEKAYEADSNGYFTCYYGTYDTVKLEFHFKGDVGMYGFDYSVVNLYKDK